MIRGERRPAKSVALQEGRSSTTALLMHLLFANELLVKTIDIPEDLRVSKGGN